MNNPKYILGPDGWKYYLDNGEIEHVNRYYFSRYDALEQLVKDWPEGYEMVTQNMVKKSKLYTPETETKYETSE